MMSSHDFSLHLSSMGAELRRRLGLLRDRYEHSARGLCLWLKSRIPARILAERLLNEGIRVTPGDIYGPTWADHVRVSVLRPSAVEFQAAMDRVFAGMAGNKDPRLISLL